MHADITIYGHHMTLGLSKFILPYMVNAINNFDGMGAN